ncbi:MAG: hypothetical protein COA88_01805 [Kordia sp.]|nr:MAG: hypothetical protein COA88_01805 [Kordia sp.]
MKSTKQLLALLVVGLLFISCDKDYNTIGEGLVNETHFNQKTDSESQIKTTQHVFGENGVTPNPVQADNLSYNTLGYYNHPVYGGTTANILSQVTLSEYGKDFGGNPVVSRVVLSVPYFSRSTDADAGTYELDSIYGEGNEINLKMYKSDYFLNDFDASGDTQHYYTNAYNGSLAGIESQLLFEKTDFTPLSSEVTGELVDGEYEKLSPRLREELNVADFQWMVASANQSDLSSASNFKNYYRGIYLKATNVSVEGVLVGLNLSQAEIQVFYEYDDPDGGVDPLEGSVKILFSGTKVNTFENSFSYPDIPGGSHYLNGGQGAMITVDLFAGDDIDDNKVSDKLDDLRSRDILINEAILEFYVDQSTAMGNDSEPDRLFLFDIENNKVLLDYQFDSTSENDTNLTQLNHLEKLERDALGFGVKYKLRITEHITDLIRNDSTNVKLGLVVTNNVLAIGSSDLKTAVVIAPSNDIPSDRETSVKTIFSASVNSHKGTVLYNENAVDEAKRIKLTIYYTEENN